MKYVAGFMFFMPQSFSDPTVALVKKYDPPWQRGKLNGIGGKVENDEIPLEAMVREFKEETGLITIANDWEQVCALHCDNGNIVYFMKCIINDKCPLLKSLNPPEEISWHNVERVLKLQDGLIIPNLRWLIPMALYANELTPPILTEK